MHVFLYINIIKLYQLYTNIDSNINMYAFDKHSVEAFDEVLDCTKH